MYKYWKDLMTNAKVCVFITLLFLNACDNGIIGTGLNSGPTKQGFAQKGPFEIGSNINIVIRPGPDYIETRTVQVQTLDGIGRFDFTFEPDTLYDITVTGRHFNEITGQLTELPNSLKSTYYHNQNSQAFVSVNILTHLIHSRINYLIKNGVAPQDANTQASEELIRELSGVLFAEHLRNPSFSSMAVYNLENSDYTANAVLLFISAAFYQQSIMYPNSATLMEIIDFIAADLEIDGRIDTDKTTVDSGLISSLDYAAHSLNPDTIATNLIEYSIEVTGSALPVPDISFLLDNDGDGISNNIDNDDDGDGFLDSVDATPYTFEIIASQQAFTTNLYTSVDIDLQFSQPQAHFLNSIWVGYDTQPSNGKLSGAYPNIVYTPNQNTVATKDSFKYVVYCPTYASLYTSDVITVNIIIEQ